MVVAVGALHTAHVQWQDTTTRRGAVTSGLLFHDGGRRPGQRWLTAN